MRTAGGGVGRGAFLAHGSLTEPGRSSALEVDLPRPRGRAGRWSEQPGASASRPRLGRCAESIGVVIRDGDGQSEALLNQAGRPTTGVLAWGGAPVCAGEGSGPPPTGLANFDDANLRRSAAGRRSLPVARVEAGPWSLLGEEAPEHLVAAGHLQHRGTRRPRLRGAGRASLTRP